MEILLLVVVGVVSVLPLLVLLFVSILVISEVCSSLIVVNVVVLSPFPSLF